MHIYENEWSYMTTAYILALINFTFEHQFPIFFFFTNLYLIHSREIMPLKRIKFKILNTVHSVYMHKYKYDII